ncbi:hypothetical protein EYZ11_011583 [Aspergillus tanneri]|uniref:histidine kinase n=1 Tax=Aspergillus tanneri TaxID=1220188 RepID=A0A4S3J4L3_9EURO|nr:uncharacterized protein ATNIH1004_011458 [Aspergillus tanneri]KAA8642513.1 hypothetical protein ATNIH1004_011458 [Aspergillus tanneri]THC88968.1 hypothetical protein EYZ11_011583 [Aspergillus tanneri]
MTLPIGGTISAQQLADILPNGFAVLNSRDERVFMNRRFEELMLTQSPKTFESWSHSIHEEDYPQVARAYHEAIRLKRRCREEYRIREHRSMWRVVILTPLDPAYLHQFDLDEEGGFICIIADFTQEKTAELSQRRIAEEAEERKKQQERFIDMISHEVRNPLSAILHCTEDILEAIHKKTEGEGIDVAEIATAADTISFCVAHQKKIIDDVLTFSKLDASMLTLSPRRVMPRREIATTLTMFRPELRKHGIQFEYILDQSYADCAVDWVVADMDRMGQVLINLVSNAIKFTAKSGGEKSIRVSMGASRERPSSYPPNVVFFDFDGTASRMDGTSRPEWGTGDAVYMMVAIKDTGIGISDEAQKRLFQRFKQATPLTESIYGGSGLGLNVSRKLTHLHGGEVGVSSKENSGSTFGFYFTVRRIAEGAVDDPCPRGTDSIDELCSDIHKLGNELTSVNRRTKQPEISGTPPMVAGVSDVTPGAFDERVQHTAKLLRQIEHPVAEATSRPQNHQNLNSKPTATGDSESSRRILLVEDNVINRQVLSRKLKSLGFQVSEARNGREALDAVQRTSYSCVLMDQVMPIMDGNAATRAIREIEKDTHTHVPVLGVTANVREAQKEEMLAAGMDDILHKPYKTNDLAEKIDGLISKLS